MFCRNESKLLLICALLACSTLSYGQDEATNDVTKKTTATIPTTIATSTTEKPETTTTTTTTSTPKPTTRSTTSTTTTTTTTTPTPPPTTTTVKPSPTPPPEPEMGTWITGCIIVQMAAKFNLTYETKDNNIAIAQINLPKQSVVNNSSTCLETTQQIILEWGTSNNISSIMMQFEKKDDNYFLYELYLKIILNDVEFAEANNHDLKYLFSGNMFMTPINMSYHCKKQQLISMRPSNNNTKIGNSSIILRNLQLNAFNDGSGKFSPAIDCENKKGYNYSTIVIIILVVLFFNLCCFNYSRCFYSCISRPVGYIRL